MDSALPNYKSINATKFKASSRGRGGRGRGTSLSLSPKSPPSRLHILKPLTIKLGRGAKPTNHGISQRAAVAIDHKAGVQSVPSEDINGDDWDESSYIMTGEEILVKERIAIDLPTHRNEVNGDLMIKTYLTVT
jgi:hypothetical protein